MEGNAYISESYMDTLLYGTPLGKTSGSSIKTLSKWEFQVYTLITLDITSKEIAEKLELSQKTVSTYRTRILKKLLLSRTAQVIQHSLQNPEKINL